MRGAWSALLTVLVAAVAATGYEPEELDALENLKARILAGLGMQRPPDLRNVNVSAEHVQRMTRRYFRNLKHSEQELLTYHQTVVTTGYEPEELEALENTKARILTGLCMQRPAGLRNVDVSAEHVQHMTRKYLRNLHSEQELLTYHQTGFDENNYLIFKPDMEYLSSFQWARLRFPNLTSMDISTTVKKWRMDSSDSLQVDCRERLCKKAKLEIMVRRPRSKRSTCNRECCRRPLKISFKEIGWDWIVQPVEFEAFYCKGRCRTVSDDFASTHALMQSILKNKGRNVTRPCCAPRKLRPLNLLHYNDKNPPELVVTRKKGMIVKECACA